MFTTELHWVEKVKPLRLALMARPRGGEWLAEEVAAWKSERIGTIVSLLEAAEVRELELLDEASECASAGVEFISLPIPDRGIPKDRATAFDQIERIVSQLRDGRAVAVHCRAGIGRTGLITGCVLHRLGFPFAEIFPCLSQARRVEVPDTEDQIEWVRQFSRNLPNTL